MLGRVDQELRPATSWRAAYHGVWGSVIALFLSVEPIFPQATPVLLAQREGRWGFIDTVGNAVIPSQFEDAKPFVDSLAPVRNNGKWGFINRAGAFVIPATFNDADAFAEGMAAVRIGSRRGYIDQSGNLAIPAEFELAKRFSEGFAAVRQRGVWRFIDKSGNNAFSGMDRFEAAGSFSEGLAPVRVGGLWGYLDLNGSLAIAPQFHDAKEFRSGLAPVRFAPLPDGLVGYIGRDGDTVIAPRFTWGEPFSDGAAAVQVGEFWGYVDSTGTAIIPPTYAAAGPFEHGFARVRDAVFGRDIYINGAADYVTHVTERPQDGRFGALTLQRVRISSVPGGAAVYLIPLFDWENDPNLLRKPRRLIFFQVPEGETEVRTRAYERVYMVVFVLNGQTREVRLDVVKDGENTATARF